MKKQNVLISIDVEAPIGKNGVEKLIYGKVNGREYGINHIMNILDLYKIKGLFFVDIAEAWEYGEDAVKKVLMDIDKRGHDVGVHLHPDRMADKARRYLWQYSYSEQYDLIKKCTAFYIETLKKKPKSFRAGRYGANTDTIDILSKLGYEIDMSMYYGMKKRCQIDGKYETVNCIKRMGSVLEIPVTVFKSFDLFGYVRFDKIDESMPLGEFRYVLNKAEQENSVDIISFFMHSFSFMNWRSNPEQPQFSNRNDKRIKQMIEYCRVREYDFLDEEKCIALEENKTTSRKILDTSRGLKPIYYDFVRAHKIIKEKLIRNI